MQLGATFPQTEIPADGGAVKEYAQAVESLGFDYTVVYDHVLGVDTRARPDYLPGGRQPVYNHQSLFHEPLALLAFMAGVTSNLGLATGVIILPQRQTALVAKQAAEVDVLSGGRLRLGVGIGWNEAEYNALGMNFHDRGIRSEEQILLMRALWTQDTVSFQGKWHTVDAVGINPLPVQRPIPIFLGGSAEAVVRRVARLADGWFLNGAPTPQNQAAIERMRSLAVEAGRDPATIGIEGSLRFLSTTLPEAYAEAAQAWRSSGASHVTVNTLGAGLQTVEQHSRAIEMVRDAVGAVR